MSRPKAPGPMEGEAFLFSAFVAPKRGIGSLLEFREPDRKVMCCEALSQAPRWFPLLLLSLVARFLTVDLAQFFLSRHDEIRLYQLFAQFRVLSFELLHPLGLG